MSELGSSQTWPPIETASSAKDHGGVALTIRTYWPDDDTWSYFEADPCLWPVRQVDLRGSDREPVTAAALREVLWIRDHANPEAMAAYEQQYGVLAEGDLSGWPDADQATEITATQFEQLWAMARQTLQAAQPAEQATNPDRTRLIRILNGATEASEPARAALRSGGDLVICDGQSPADHLAGIYGTRLQHTRREAIETLGLEQTVAILTSLGQEPVRLGRILSADELWAFILFLSPEATQVITCTGVRRRRDER